MKLTPQQLKEQRELKEQQRIFARKIEEDRLGISRKKQKRVMSFKTYRIIKLTLLFLTGLMLFVYTPAVLPLCVLIALMLPITKRIEKEKNKHVNKKYRIKIRAADSIIAIIMIALTVGITGYSLVSAYTNGGSLNTSSGLEQRLLDSGFNPSQLQAAISRRTGESSYERILNNALNLMTGNRNIFKQRRMMSRGTPPNFEGSDGSMPAMKRPNALSMMRNMPLEMLFRQILQMTCAVAVGIMVIVGTINVIESLKYGEIKRVTLAKKFLRGTAPNDPCGCGSGKKIKNCDCGGWWKEI